MTTTTRQRKLALQARRQASPIITRLAIVIFALIAGATQGAPAGTGFTYQGHLASGGRLANGTFDLQFAMYDAAALRGVPLGETLERTLPVTDGVFVAELDFGADAFVGEARWLEIRVRATGETSFVTLTPRQPITAAPYAIETLFVAPGAVDTLALASNAVTEAKIADGAVTAGKLANASINAFKLQNASVTFEKLQNGAVTRDKLFINAVTNPKLAGDAVTGEKVLDGSLSGADLNPNSGVYVNKSAIYIESRSATLGGGECAVIQTPCRDANDLPLAGSCIPEPARDTSVRFTRMDNWTGNDAPATYLCEICSAEVGDFLDVSAEIACIEKNG